MNKIIITPLGTVSPYCKDNMNCPGFLIEYDNKKILLDCGNGITRLLNFPTDLNNLHAFITHFHKDHFGDLGALQYASYVYNNLGLIKEKIKIYLPEKDYCKNKEAIVHNPESFATYETISEHKHFQLGNIIVSFCDNNSHTIQTFIVKVEIGKIKIVYTSDIGTSNLEPLIDFCKNSDLLICESSFINEHNSNSKTHLTAQDAGKIAKLANVKKLVLTHFWPETAKSIYLNEAKEEFANVEIAIEGRKIIL